MLSFFHGIHGIVVRQAKTSFRSRPSPKHFRRQRQTVQPSFLLRDATYLGYTPLIPKQQTHHCTGTRTPKPRYCANITFQTTVTTCLQANALTVGTAPPCQILRQQMTPTPRLRIRAHVPPFWGPNGAKSATVKQTTQGCAVFRTCLSNNKDRVPRSLAGSLACSLDLTYCSSRFVKKGQLEYRCKLRISVLVLRVWWALIGCAGWRWK